MRSFIILRGPKASGRSSFVRERGLSPWHIDQSMIEALHAEPAHTRSGEIRIDRNARNRARDRLFDALEEKFMRGGLVIFEPSDTGSPAAKHAVSAGDRTILAAVELARTWRYEVIVVDFCDGADADILKTRIDSYADPFGLIGDIQTGRNLSHMRRRAGLQDLDAKWVSPAEIEAEGGLLAMVEPDPISLDRFDNVVAIGDIHGCYHTLKALIGPDGPRDDVAYIFTGDYINKGPRSAQVLSYLLEHFSERDNAFFLFGNHEKSLEDWVLGRMVRKKAFVSTTLPDFEARRFAKRDGRRFLSLLKDAACFKWNGTTIFATHGGFARLPKNLALLSAEHLTYGAEDALFDVDGAWEAAVLAGEIPSSKEVIQVHGHRNNHALPVAAGAGSFNLEGGVENGGALRAVIFRKRPDGGTQISTLEVPNCEAKSGRPSGPEVRPDDCPHHPQAEALRDTSIQEIV